MQRTDDHCEWIVSDRLVNAFDTYDRKSPGSGFEFTLQHSLCTTGMVGVSKSAALIDKWINVDKVERKNLYMRAYFFNQDYVEEEANLALAAAKKEAGAVDDVSRVSGATWWRLGKGLVDAFKKIDSAWDEWVRDKNVRDVHLNGLKPEHTTVIRSLSTFHRSAEGIIYKYFSEFTQSASRLGVPGKLDKGVTAIAGLMLYSRLGNLAEKLAFDELMLHVPPEKRRPQEAQRRAQRAVA